MSKYVNRWCVAAALLADPVVMSGCGGVTHEKSREVSHSSSTDVERDGTVIKKETKTKTTTP